MMESCALTDVGRVRAVNQDYTYASLNPVGTLPNLFLVADGMGGHRAGDYASRFLVEHLVDYLDSHRGRGVIGQLKTAMDCVNRDLYRESLSSEEFFGMGCTLVAAVVDEETLYVANVGDSRLYLIHGGLIHQVTRDHSYVEEMVRRGKMKRGSAEYNRQKNIITRAMGISETVEADFFEVDLEEGDYFLLCSDGLSNMVSDEEIGAIVCGEGSIGEKARHLIGEANRLGGKDNIAVVLAEPLKGGNRLC